jgi:hypothetical protein
MTRGPLPAGVYWRRRFFVVALAVTLVFVIASLLRGGSDGDSDDVPAVQQAAAPGPVTETVTVGADEERSGKRRKKHDEPLPAPEGECAASDVMLTPRVTDPVRGDDVTISLSLQTVESPACTWRVSADTVTVRISDGDTEVWTTRHCPKVVPEEDVVVRNAVSTVVEVVWRETRLSDDGCPTKTDWADEGDYTIVAAALGGEPIETDFHLPNPTPETVTPDAGETSDADDGSGDRDREDESESPEPRR